MTSVDEFVRRNILTFPSLFPNRTAVLHHALCVIGNGYEWGEDGTVVEDFRFPVSLWNKEEALAELYADLNARYEHQVVREVIGEALLNDIEASAKIVEEVETRTHERAVIEHFYPQCLEYALLMNIPANVTDDWKEACDEMKELAEKAGWTF